MRVQQAMRPLLEPERFFSPGEVIVGDAGFKCTQYIIPMFKRTARQNSLSRRRLGFNNAVKRDRVMVEHAFGILKGRWQLLRNAKLRMMTEVDEARAHALFLCAFMLHNLFVSTAELYVTKEEVDAIIEEEGTQRQWVIEVNGRYDALADNHRRREELVDSWLERQDEVDYDMLRI